MANRVLAASGLDRQLGFLLKQAQAAVWQDLKQTLEPFGLRPQSCATLMLIDATPGCKQQDIADALDIQRPNMVALIDRLVETGLVCREVKTSDRRSYALTLTEAGQKLLESSRAAHRDHELRVEACMSEADRRAMARACERLAQLA